MARVDDQWVDCTTYSQGDKERIPRIWHIRLSQYRRISVHRFLGCDGWFATFEPFFTTREVGDDLQVAKETALRMAFQCVDELVADLARLRTVPAPKKRNTKRRK